MINTNYFRTTCVLLVFLALLSGCDEYLDQTPDAVIGDADIFGTYESTQGYLDKQYAFIADVLYYRSGGYIAYGDDFVASRGSNSAMAKGDYMFAATPQFWSAFWYKARIFSRFNPATGTTTGLWPSGWIMIRDANLVLKNLRLMTDATQEERDLIKGQALFFRAYHYWNYVRNWGGMPYIDKFLEGNDDPRLPRLNTWQTIELIVKDLDEAMVLLPEDWDNTSRGLEAPGKNLGRITKGACIGLKAKALLYAGSPTFSLESSGVLDYNADYLSRAASAAWELIKLADAGVYNLVPWGPEYYRQFGRNDGFITGGRRTGRWRSCSTCCQWRVRPARAPRCGRSAW